MVTSLVILSGNHRRIPTSATGSEVTQRQQSLVLGQLGVFTAVSTDFAVSGVGRPHSSMGVKTRADWEFDGNGSCNTEAFPLRCHVELSIFHPISQFGGLEIQKFAFLKFHFLRFGRCY